MACKMALMLLLLIGIVCMVSLAFGEAEVSGAGHGPTSLKRSECPKECKRRCSETQYYKDCLKTCEHCCSKCLCVPPGTLGNKEVCPCYNNWKNKEGRPKCP